MVRAYFGQWSEKSLPRFQKATASSSHRASRNAGSNAPRVLYRQVSLAGSAGPPMGGPVSSLPAKTLASLGLSFLGRLWSASVRQLRIGSTSMGLRE
jgi:hypothetical protein